jgi:gliding motility-associated-like protein
MNDVYDLQIIRSHNPVVRVARNSVTYSTRRVFDFSVPIDVSSVRMQILPHEILNIYKLALFAHDFEDWKKVKNRDDDFFGVYRVSAFSPDLLHFPKIITPNEATNNTFEIIGLDEYPDARLVIMNKGGKILYDLHPYTNDFDGKNLPNGTYYYIFSEERGSEPIKKSFFEIVK